MKIAVYPGSFDPVTNGHIDIIQRSSVIFDIVYVVVARNSSKKNSFSPENRMRFISTVINQIPHVDNVKIDSFNGLLIDYMKKINATFIIRGLRAVSDFEYEFQLALTNNKLYPPAETVFLAASNQYQFLSSSTVREIARYGGCLDDFVPPVIAQEIMDWLREDC